MEMCAICKLWLLVCVVAVVRGQHFDCTQQLDNYLKCQRNVETSDDAKVVQQKNRETIEKCIGKDAILKCISKYDDCKTKAFQAAEGSPVKQQSLSDGAKCFSNGNVPQQQQQNFNNQRPPFNGPMQGQQMQGPPTRQASPMMPNGPKLGPGMTGTGPMPSGSPQQMESDLTPSECRLQLDAKMTECLTNQTKSIDPTLLKKIDNQMKQCYDSIPTECIPQNTEIVACLFQASTPLTNLTQSVYRQCMVEAGYKFA